jgi:hypothetical protein
VGDEGIPPTATAEDLGERLVQQAFDLWINPELDRRRAAGGLSADFSLYAAQIIINVGIAPITRLNDEVMGVVRGVAARPIEKGENVSCHDLLDIHHVELTSEDANAGHMTLLLQKGRWFVEFDFRYNAQRIADTVEAAREFLDAARFCSERGYVRAFCENLFGATELLAKGTLLMLPDEKILSSKKHDYVASHFNRWGKYGNTDPRYVGLLNQLGRLRSSARYVSGDVNLTATEMSEMLTVAEEMFTKLRDQAPTRSRV